MELLLLDDQYILKGNIIPEEWYRKFINNKGSPDLPLISVLSEIVYWYRPKEIKDPITGEISYVSKFPGDFWQTSYAYFQKKFSFKPEKTRKIMVKLETMGIAKREFRTITIGGQNYNNRLFVRFNKERFKLYEGEVTTIQNCSKESGKEPFFEAENLDHSPLSSCPSPLLPGVDKNKNKNNKNRSRSADANFFKGGESNNQGGESNQSESDLDKNSFDKVKTLKDFYPLTPEDCQTLQSLSKRDFSLKAMNEILQDMGNRLTGKSFKTKKAFLNYMVKVFAYEKRQPEDVNSDSFRIEKNMGEDEIAFREREKYLSKIEYSLEISPEARFKKRMAVLLPQKTAYELLRSYKTVSISEETFTLNLTKYVELGEPDKQIILEQAQFTHEKIDLNGLQSEFIRGLQIIMPEKPAAGENRAPHAPQLPDDIWGTMRSKLINSIHRGRWIDFHWFSKLEASIDEESRKLTLKAPNSFVQQWVQSNYLCQIQQVCKTENYQFEGIKI